MNSEKIQALRKARDTVHRAKRGEVTSDEEFAEAISAIGDVLEEIAPDPWKALEDAVIKATGFPGPPLFRDHLERVHRAVMASDWADAVECASPGAVAARALLSREITESVLSAGPNGRSPIRGLANVIAAARRIKTP